MNRETIVQIISKKPPIFSLWKKSLNRLVIFIGASEFRIIKVAFMPIRPMNKIKAIFAILSAGYRSV